MRGTPAIWDPLRLMREMAMRKLVGTLALVPILLIGLQAPSAVAGGNWLEFRSAESDPQPSSRWDIFTVGESLVARGDYLSDALEPGTGPYYLWIELGEAVEAGQPIPQSALRVGVFMMAPDGRSAHAAFDLPALRSGTYSFAVCDDPCTERGFGFGEFVQGWLTVTQTPDEARLLARVRELRGIMRSSVRGLRTEVRQAERQEARLRTRLDTTVGALEESRAQVERLTQATSRTPDPDVIDGTAAALIAVGLIAIAAVLLRTRRRVRIVVPDTPAELLSEDLRSVET
jgi:hypothetical protein